MHRRTRRVCSRIVAADVRRRILARKDFRLVISEATALATMLELTLPDAA
jgi:hypothetical protein